MNETKKYVGKIQHIWLYPVKSMQGVLVPETEISNGGVIGDRSYAVMSIDKKTIASAKNPKKWGDLLKLHAQFTHTPESNKPLPEVEIQFPNNMSILNSDPQVHSLLSDYIGQDVELSTTRSNNIIVERVDPLDANESVLDIGELMLANKFSDYADMHIITTSTLKKLSKISPDIDFDERRFRPNLVIDTENNAGEFLENNWVGKKLIINDVCFDVTDPTPRCAIPTLSNGEFSNSPELLKTIVDNNTCEVPLFDNKALPCAGIYGFILRPGSIKKGDPVYIDA